MLRLSLLLPLTLSLAGCAHYQMACPHDGGPRWLELTSAHFTLRTDLPETQAREVIRKSEEILVSFVAGAEFFLPATPDVGRTTIVLFAELWEYQKMVTSQEVRAGWFELGRTVVDDAQRRPAIIMAADVHASEVFRHELTHRLVHQRLGPVPGWLDEGLAEYFSQIDAAGDKVALGAFTHRMQQAVQAARSHSTVPGFPLAPLAVVTGDWWPGSLINVCYLDSWALVHYLANGGADHAERFRRFLAALADGASAGDALQAQYGDWSHIEAGYRAHAEQFVSTKTQQWFISFAAAPVTTEPALRHFLDDAEVHELKAALRPSIAARELELARAHGNDASPALHRWLARQAEARGDDATAESESARMVALAADDSSYVYERAQLRLERALRQQPAQRRMDAIASDMEEIADRVEEPRELDTVARFFAVSGHAARGVKLAERAVALEPQCASCIVTLASLYFATGDLARALEAQELAVRRWRDKSKMPPEVGAALAKLRCARMQQQNLAARCPER